MEIANSLTGRSFTFEDMPGDVDWYGLAKLLKDDKKIPFQAENGLGMVEILRNIKQFNLGNHFGK